LSRKKLENSKIFLKSEIVGKIPQFIGTIPQYLDSILKLKITLNLSSSAETEYTPPEKFKLIS
jgi:hypothetical protein